MNGKRNVKNEAVLGKGRVVLRRILTVILADVLRHRAGGAEGDELVVLVELAEGHSQAVVWEEQEDFIQDVRDVLQMKL